MRLEHRSAWRGHAEAKNVSHPLPHWTAPHRRRFLFCTPACVLPYNHHPLPHDKPAYSISPLPLVTPGMLLTSPMHSSATPDEVTVSCNSSQDRLRLDWSRYRLAYAQSKCISQE